MNNTTQPNHPYNRYMCRIYYMTVNGDCIDWMSYMRMRVKLFMRALMHFKHIKKFEYFSTKHILTKFPFILHASDVPFSFTIDWPYNHLPFSLLFIFDLLANHPFYAAFLPTFCFVFFLFFSRIHSLSPHTHTISFSFLFWIIYYWILFMPLWIFHYAFHAVCAAFASPPFLYGCKPSLAFVLSLSEFEIERWVGTCWLAGDQTFSDQLKSLHCILFFSFSKSWLKF